ncbi:serine--tRNA ligase, mitochondrial-like [Mya arenaria]|uniref:serine--tRNA ligase, mitochondrial-like n=1 Tax=Mya arenaria TaxID=6604 RepID=UPI0022DF2F5E|nr:serine--tRNA ligase, mitochondrial-like [Mya arenaria]
MNISSLCQKNTVIQRCLCSMFGLNGKRQLLTYQLFKTVEKQKCAKNLILGRFKSSLFTSDRDTNTSNFQYDHGLEKKLMDTEELERNLRLRSCSIDVDKLKDDYSNLCKLEAERNRIETERARVAQHIANIVKHMKEDKTKSKEIGDKMKKLKIEGKILKETLKDVLNKLWAVEERVMYTALSLPNSTLPDVPVNEENVIEEHFTDACIQVDTDHLNVLEQSNMVKLSNVGAKAYYLTGQLAVLEQELISHFSSSLRQQGFQLILAPEIFKAPVVEAGGYNLLDPSSIYRMQPKHGTSPSDWDQDFMFLRGASHLSFLAYYARMMINSSDLPQEKFIVGRSYKPESEDCFNGLYGVLQTVQVSACGLSESSSQSMDIQARFLQILTDIYADLGLSFRIVSMPVPSLKVHEQSRLEVQMWAPTLHKYLKVGSVSIHGDYCSSRLMIRCSQKSLKDSHPVHMVYAEVVDITRLVAIMLDSFNTVKT